MAVLGAAPAVRLLKTLVAKLPPSIPLATADGWISEVFKKVPEPVDLKDHWQVFNQ
ncbi:hypothetical protein VKT23_003043 [Stygiomarasmius scandens]|uniref:Uncharacterized protein n=1 Tax=Marasmiellus scandens TaxID=2682957 RepID=A0ABR1JXH2_9AGAR